MKTDIELLSADSHGPGQQELRVEPRVVHLVIFQEIGCPIQSLKHGHHKIKNSNVKIQSSNECL
jgi:hypothetical protein